MIVEWMVIWIPLSIVTAVVARNKGRSAIGFFFLSLFLSPIIGLIAVLFVQPNITEVELARINSGADKKCTYCAELIKKDAVVCRYCGREVSVLHPDNEFRKEYLAPSAALPNSEEPDWPAIQSYLNWALIIIVGGTTVYTIARFALSR